MSVLQNHTRRKFINDISLTTAAIVAGPVLSRALEIIKQDKITVGEIIDKFIKDIPGAPFPNTVDR